MHIKYVQAITPRDALSEFKNELDQEEQLHYYFECKQID